MLSIALALPPWCPTLALSGAAAPQTPGGRLTVPDTSAVTTQRCAFGVTVGGMALQHLDDVPEQDRELVSPPDIKVGDEVFHPQQDRWVRVERVVAGLQATSSTWKLDEREEDKWTFHHSLPDDGVGSIVSGPVERRKR